jgi:thiamine-monophosphate kinase
VRPLKDIHENQVLSRWAALLPRPAGQLGSVHQTDAELVPLGDGRLLALTVDALVEEVALGLFSDPFTAARTAAISSLSDLAAVGAEPLGLLLCVTLPAEPGVQEAVARGVGEVCEAAGTFVLGGDSNDGERLEITVTAAGLVPETAVRTRVGLEPGHQLFASGPLGAGAALAARTVLGVKDDVYAEADYRPPVRIREGIALRGLASACMDTSDGLVATLDQLARLNGCGVRVDAAPAELLEPGAARLSSHLGLPALPFLAAHHGEFELVFGVAPDRISELQEVAGRIAWRPVHLGEAVAGEGIWFGERELDTTAIRNLLHETGNDLGRYVAGLLALTAEG